MDDTLKVIVLDRDPRIRALVPLLQGDVVIPVVDDTHGALNVHNLLDVLLDRLVLVPVDDNGTVVNDLLNVVDYAVNKSDRIDARRWRIAPAVDIRLGRCIVVL